MKKTFILCTLLLATLIVAANPVGKERATRVAQNAVARFCAERHNIDTKQPIVLSFLARRILSGLSKHIVITIRKQNSYRILIWEAINGSLLIIL